MIVIFSNRFLSQDFLPNPFETTAKYVILLLIGMVLYMHSNLNENIVYTNRFSLILVPRLIVTCTNVSTKYKRLGLGKVVS